MAWASSLSKRHGSLAIWGQFMLVFIPFLAEKNTKAEQFALSVAQSGSMSTMSSSSLSEHEAAWHVMRSGDGRENLGFGRYDVHAYQIKHDVDVIRFERLEGMLKWLVDAVKSMEGIPPFEKVTRSTKTSEWMTLNELGVLDSEDRYVSVDTELWKGALPRVSSVKVMDMFIKELSRTISQDPELKDIELPSPYDLASSFSVGDLTKIGGIVTNVHDVDEVILFHPQSDLSATGVQEKGILSSVLDFFK